MVKKTAKQSDDVSNKTLAVMLAAVIVISLGGTIVILLKAGKMPAGLSVDTASGTAQITIGAAAAIQVVNNSIVFGNGYVYANSTSCTIDSGVDQNGNSCPLNGTWSNVTDGNNSEFVIRNVGNIDVQIQVSTGKNAASFIGGTSPAYNYQSHDDETEGGCQGGVVTSWTAVNTTTPGDLICANLTYGAGTRQMEMDLQLTIPSDAPPGDNSDTVTFTGTSI